MLDIFISTLDSIAPIVLLILLGYLLKRVGFLSKPFVKVGNSFVFMVCLPCMIFLSIYDGMDSFSDIPWNFVAYCLIAIVVMFFIGLVVSVFTTKRNDRRGVITQVTFRCNFAIIGLVLITRIGGSEAAAIGGMVSAFSAPLCNILAVIALEIFDSKNRREKALAGGGEGLSDEGGAYSVLSDDTVVADLALTGVSPDVSPVAGDVFVSSATFTVVSDALYSDGTAAEDSGRKKKKNKKPAQSPSTFWGMVRQTVINIFTNPVVIGALAGLLFVGIREIERAATGGDVPFTLKGDLSIIYTIIDDLRVLCSPFALIILGGQFEFKAAHGMTKEIVVGVIMRIVVSPLLGIGCAVLIDSYTNFFAAGIDYPTLLAILGTPVAVSSAIMAGNMGGDRQLATQYVVWTSV
ncbi:MAG: AEC family transporter, partial [Clostridia bacterium]|nr:AEC family transporter [Clostridia bacterium]